MSKIPVAAFGENFAAIGRLVKSVERYVVRHVVLDRPIKRNGRVYPHELRIERHTRTDDGEETTETVRRHFLRTEAEVKTAWALWEKRIRAEHQKKPRRLKPSALPAPPARCTPVNAADHAAHVAAMLNALAREYPRTVKALQSKFSTTASLSKAYLADAAQISGTVLPESEPRDAAAIGEALLKFAAGKTERASAVDREIVFGWFARGYCFLAGKELAAAVNSRCGTAISPAAIKKRRERLGLFSKRGPGPDYVYR